MSIMLTTGLSPVEGEVEPTYLQIMLLFEVVLRPVDVHKAIRHLAAMDGSLIPRFVGVPGK